MFLKVLYEWRFVIVIIIAIIIYCLLEGKAKIYQLMLQAERLAKHGEEIAKTGAMELVLKSGQDQEDWVVIQAYKILPKWITVWISQAAMHRIVKWLFHTGKDYLDNGKLDNSIKE